MTKSFLIFFIMIIFFLLFSSQAKALCTDPAAGSGLVPCGITVTKDANGVSKIVCPCEIGHFFEMLGRIYNFIVKFIATPLAIIAITIGGLFMLISAGDPGLFGKGKEILKWSIIGLFLVFGSWVIINFILKTLGYTPNWWQL